MKAEALLRRDLRIATALVLDPRGEWQPCPTCGSRSCCDGGSCASLHPSGGPCCEVEAHVARRRTS